MMVLELRKATKNKGWGWKSLRGWSIRSTERSPSHMITVRQSGWIFRLSQYDYCCEGAGATLSSKRCSFGFAGRVYGSVLGQLQSGDARWRRYLISLAG